MRSKPTSPRHTCFPSVSSLTLGYILMLNGRACCKSLQLSLTTNKGQLSCQTVFEFDNRPTSRWLSESRNLPKELSGTRNCEGGEGGGEREGGGGGGGEGGVGGGLSREMLLGAGATSPEEEQLANGIFVRVLSRAQSCCHRWAGLNLKAAPLSMALHRLEGCLLIFASDEYWFNYYNFGKPTN